MLNKGKWIVDQGAPESGGQTGIIDKNLSSGNE